MQRESLEVELLKAQLHESRMETEVANSKVRVVELERDIVLGRASPPPGSSPSVEVELLKRSCTGPTWGLSSRRASPARWS